MPSNPPLVVVLGGPNGAGKSTSAAHPLRGVLAVDEFVNVDFLAPHLIASGTAMSAADIVDSDRWNHLKASV